MISTKGKSDADTLKEILSKAKPSGDFDPRLLFKRDGAGTIAECFKLGHSLSKSEDFMGRIPWGDIKGGVPKSMKGFLAETYFKKHKIPSFKDLHEVARKIARNHYKEYRGYDGSKQHKAWIQALIAYRLSNTLNNELKEMGVAGYVEIELERLGLSEEASVVRDEFTDVSLGIDVLVQDKLEDHILRLHINTGWRGSRFSNRRRNDRGYEMDPDIDVEISFKGMKDNELCLYPNQQQRTIIVNRLKEYFQCL